MMNRQLFNCIAQLKLTGFEPKVSIPCGAQGKRQRRAPSNPVIPTNFFKLLMMNRQLFNCIAQLKLTGFEPKVSIPCGAQGKRQRRAPSNPVIPTNFFKALICG